MGAEKYKVERHMRGLMEMKTHTVMKEIQGKESLFFFFCNIFHIPAVFE